MRGLLSGVPESEPARNDETDNVVQLPRPTLDDLERQLIDAQNALITAGVECDRAAMIYKDRTKSLDAARTRMAERLKESGALVEFVQKFPELE